MPVSGLAVRHRRLHRRVGFHGAVAVGTPMRIDDTNRDALASTLAQFEATLWCDGDLVDRGAGANVMDSPALALGHVARVIAEQPGAPALGAGEVVTTGTLTNAPPCAPASSGERTTARRDSSRSR